MSKSINLIFLLLLLIPFTTTQAQSRQARHFLGQYLQVAQRKFGTHRQPLKKWENKDTLRYFVTGQLQYISDKQWKRFLNTVSGLTNLTILKSEDPETYDILIFFGPLDEYFKMTSTPLPVDRLNFNSWQNCNWNSQNQLALARFCLDPSRINNTSYGTYLLKVNLLKSLGLATESDDEYSLFYNQYSGSNTDLNKNDKRFIKLHYHEAVASGMDEYELKEAIITAIHLDTFLKEKL